MWGNMSVTGFHTITDLCSASFAACQPSVAFHRLTFKGNINMEVWRTYGLSSVSVVCGAALLRMIRKRMHCSTIPTNVICTMASISYWSTPQAGNLSCFTFFAIKYGTLQMALQLLLTGKLICNTIVELTWVIQCSFVKLTNTVQ